MSSYPRYVRCCQPNGEERFILYETCPRVGYIVDTKQESIGFPVGLERHNWGSTPQGGYGSVGINWELCSNPALSKELDNIYKDF